MSVTAAPYWSPPTPVLGFCAVASSLRADAVPIEISGLTKRFGGIQAITDVGFTVAPGRVTGFLGPNGAGKTTTLRILLGLVKATAGTATIGGLRYEELQ